MKKRFTLARGTQIINDMRHCEESGAGRTPLQKVPVARFGMESSGFFVVRRHANVKAACSEILQRAKWSEIAKPEPLEKSKKANGEHLLDGAVYQNCDEQDPRYITAEHREDARLGQMRGQKPAFSLAEMLITLTIIGIVAVFTIGIIVPKIQQKTLNTQVKTAKIKVTKAMEQMVIANKVGRYYNTSMDFAKEFSGFLKIAKICDKDHLSDCLGYKQIVLADGEKFNIAEDVTNGSTFGMIKDDYNDYTGDTVGIQTIDGASMILAWNKKCQDQYPYQVFEWANDTNGSTSCIAAAIDVNGKDGPNQIEKDIVLLNALRLGNATSCAISINVDGIKLCWSAPFPANVPLTHTACENKKDELGIKNCRDGADDYWGYAVYKCGGTQNLPTAGQLYVLARYLYQDENGTYPTIAASGQTTGLTLNTDVLSNLSSQFPTDGFTLWSGLEYSQDYSYFRLFGPESAYYGSLGSRYGSSRWAVCSLQ